MIMMKRSCDTIVLLLAIGVGFASAHSNTSAGVVDVDSRFAEYGLMDLYSTNPPENECTSSLGVSMALSLVYPSAISDSEIQMRTILGYPDPPASQSMLLWEKTTNSLTSRYAGRCFHSNSFTGDCFGKEPTLAISNTVFVDEAVTLNASYAAVVGELVQQLDFSNDMAGSFINHWVNETTNGLIDSIVDDGPLDDLHLMAVNSIYLKASWADSFNEQHTNEDLFYLSDLSSANPTTSNAHFMHKVDKYPYSDDALPGYQILQLGFTGDSDTDSNKLSMIFVLPLLNFEAEEEAQDDESSSSLASAADVLDVIPLLEQRRVAVGIPKFRFEAKYEDDLREALQNMGMTAPFDPERVDNFCIAEGSCHTYIDMIIQKTFIDVNEKGVEAAAATAVGMMMMSAPIFTDEPTLFLADRPFQFFLYDDKDKLMLFEGQVGDPGIPEGSVVGNVASDKGKHDSGFWQDVFGVNPTAPPEADIEIEVEEPEEEEDEGSFASEGEYDIDEAVTSTTKTGPTTEKEEAPTGADAAQEQQEVAAPITAASQSTETDPDAIAAITTSITSSATAAMKMMKLVLPLLAGLVFLLD